MSVDSKFGISIKQDHYVYYTSHRDACFHHYVDGADYCSTNWS